MRSSGFTGWCLVTALLPGLGGCARVDQHRAAETIQLPESEIVGAGAKILEQEPLCVLPPRAIDNNWGEYGYLAARDRAAIEPFLQAGLLKLIDKPAKAPDVPDRLWYDFTPYGGNWSASCLVNRYAYPVDFAWGFRIGTPEIVKTYPLTVFTRGECESSGGAMFEYRMKLEPWFVQGRFETNFGTDKATHYFDAAQNIGRAHVNYSSGDGRHWFQEPISHGHQGYMICEKLK